MDSMGVEKRLNVLVPAFQARLRAYAFTPELAAWAAELQRLLAPHRTQRASTGDRTRLKALSILAEYLDALGRAAEAATLLKPTARELIASVDEWPGELAAAPDLAATRRLHRQRVWCCAAYAICLIRASQLDEAARWLTVLTTFVERHLMHARDFPCHGTNALLRYFRGVLLRNRGLLNEASLDFDAALEQANLRSRDKQAKYSQTDAERWRRETIYHRVTVARILGFGHGGIALSRGRYVEARAWLEAAQLILAQAGQEMWRRSLEVHSCCAWLLIQDLDPAHVSRIAAQAAQLQDLAAWFGERNPRNAAIAEAFAILAAVRQRQIAGLAAGDSLLVRLDLTGGLLPRLDACLRRLHRDTGPLSASAALRLIGCLLRAHEYRRAGLALARFRRTFGLHEDHEAEFQTSQAELWMETGKLAAARALLVELVERRPSNRAFLARGWALLAWCEHRHGQTIWAERALAAARDALGHVQDGITKALVSAMAHRLGQTREPAAAALPCQSPDADPRWCDLDYNLRHARLNVVEAVHRRHPDYGVAKLAALMGRGHSWLYGFLAEHREVEWVGRLLRHER